MSLKGDKSSSAQEVLVLDAEVEVLKAVQNVLLEAGLSVTAVASSTQARDQVLNRFFSVVLCDLDTPSLEGAIDFIHYVRDRSPLTAVIAMSRRTSFDIVASAFRAGAADVIPENKHSVVPLRERVCKAARDVQSALCRDQLMADLADTNDDLVRKLMELSGRATELEDKLLSRDSDASSSASRLKTIRILVVDDRSDLVEALEKSLPEEQGWRLQHALSGGQALDIASQLPPQIVVTKESLPDLTGTMVAKTIKAAAPGVVALLFIPPSEGQAGEIKMMDQSRLHTLIPRFASPADLVGQLAEVRAALVRKARDKRTMKVFQTQYMEILQRCHRLRRQLDATLNKS